MLFDFYHLLQLISTPSLLSFRSIAVIWIFILPELHLNPPLDPQVELEGLTLQSSNEVVLLVLEWLKLEVTLASS